MKWVRLFLGPQPELRIIIVLLALIAFLVFKAWKQEENIVSEMSYIEHCGGYDKPCRVEIQPPNN